MRKKLSLKRLAKLSAASTEVMILADVIRFRRAGRDFVHPEDKVLEIGCSTGELTRILAATGAQVVAVDVAKGFVRQLQADMAGVANVTVARVDARNTPQLVDLLPDPSVIFIDIGGDATLDNVALQISECLHTYTPRLMVIRSVELAMFCSLITACDPPAKSTLRPISERDRAAHALKNLLALSRSTSADCRAYAARKLRLLSAPAACERLTELRADPHPRVRRIVGVTS